MPAYQYTAVDAKGRRHRGMLEGDTPRQVRQALRERQLLPLAVEDVVTPTPRGQALATKAVGGGGRWTRPWTPGLASSELALATRQLATLVAGGVPLEEALGAVARQGRPATARLFLGVRSRVLEGRDFAGALGDFPRAFLPLYRATAAAGEQSGHLDLVLERLADYLETRQALRQKVLLALCYPALLTATALAIVAALLGYVVPQVVQVFASLDQQLPALTVGLIAISDAVRHYGLGGLAGLALLAVGGYAAGRRTAVRRRLHRLQLALPVVGALVRGLDIARYARTLSILTASGVPLLEALAIAAQVVGNDRLRQAALIVRDRVQEGSSLHSAMAETGQFPPLTVALVASGETSGRLEELLTRAAVQGERETETRVATLLALFEPLLILLMGGVVLTIVLAILLPIFELNQLVR
ncbi:MAG: type II secretion system inner membrane protein GspF [Candidatus Competibacterales bacterium]